jgi:hypothetical protein
MGEEDRAVSSKKHGPLGKSLAALEPSGDENHLGFFCL